VSKHHLIAPALMILAVSLGNTAFAQPNGGPRNQDSGVITRIEAGATIAVRVSQSISTSRQDNRVYTGTVDQDVRAGNGRIAIPRGSPVELIVRLVSNNNLILDLESVTVMNQRYAVNTDPTQQQQTATNESPLVGAIIGAVTGGQASGRSVRVRQGSLLTFRLERPLDLGITDAGTTRSGKHYHDYYRPR
jgi:hypothetical protein